MQIYWSEKSKEQDKVMSVDAIKVSVIVPVYNAESTISKCLDSLVNQTLSGWEVILVDDGSTDSSGKICDSYEEKSVELYKGKGEIHVIHRENGGVSAARQTGLDAAKGEYVIHVDPDDWVEPNMLKELYDLAKIENVDMVICDFISEINGKLYYKSQSPTSLCHCDVLNDMFGKIHGSCCNKLVRRECILQCDAHFPIGINYCEDVCFNVQLLKHDIKIAYLNRAYYHYVQKSTSLTNNYTLTSFENQKRFVDFLITQLPSNSQPIVKSKVLIKKLVFRAAVLSRRDFKELYPEIQDSEDTNLLLKWMYNSAFKDYYIIANMLLYVYNSFHRLKK